MSCVVGNKEKGLERNQSMSDESENEQLVVGIGASAGGLEALRTFFVRMPADTGMVFVVIQHLAPDYKSLMVELLARCTKMPVLRAEDGMQVTGNSIYLIPPRFNLTIDGRTLHLSAPPEGKLLNLPIDIFLNSLAQSCGERSVAIILSGTGSDGTRGIRAIKEGGGMVMVQDEASAKFAGMPNSAIATGTADFVLPVEGIPDQLVKYALHPYQRKESPSRTESNEAQMLEEVCRRLKKVTGIDFSLYKHATLSRRIERRINIAQLPDLEHYLRYLLQSEPEAESLGKDLLISVTKFFRDQESFQALEVALEKVFAQTPDKRQVRVWSAGCATGEEAYSLAMLCDRIRRRAYPLMDFKVFATDVDQHALEVAAAGVYPRGLLADMPPELVEQYFVADEKEQYRVNRLLRDRLIFARQNLTADPPFTRIDLVSCRNILIYLRTPAQRRLLAHLHFSLNPNGLLLLGNSETIGDLNYAFEAVDAKNRLYRKVNGVSLRPGDLLSGVMLGSADGTAGGGDIQGVSSALDPERNRPALGELIRNKLVERLAPATLVTDQQYQLLYTIGPVAEFLKFTSGVPDLDLLKLLPRNLSLAVSTAGAQAMREHKVVEYQTAIIDDEEHAGKSLFLSVEPMPVLRGKTELKTLVITLRRQETGAAAVAPTDSFSFDHQLNLRVQELEKELLSTRDNLQAAIEQQETSNEELQAANEELLAANEELQSTNEELESVNEELYTVNAEYQSKIHELTEVNDDIENFIRSTDIGTIFFDADLSIRKFTPQIGLICGLVPQDTGRLATTFAHPVMRAIVEQAPVVFKDKVVRETVISLENQGEHLLKVQPYKQAISGMDGLVASLVDVTRVRAAEKELSTILNSVRVGICVTDEEGRFVRVNRYYAELYGYQESELIGRHFTVVVPPENREQARALHDSFLLQGEEMPAVWTVLDSSGKAMSVKVRASLLEYQTGGKFKITIVERLEPEIPVERPGAQ